MHIWYVRAWFVKATTSGKINSHAKAQDSFKELKWKKSKCQKKKIKKKNLIITKILAREFEIV